MYGKEAVEEKEERRAVPGGRQKQGMALVAIMQF
jgi:hypothetical protein